MTAAFVNEVRETKNAAVIDRRYRLSQPMNLEAMMVAL